MSLTTTTRTAAQTTVPLQEAVMGQPFPSQHPAVVLRSHFKLVRALLIVAMAAVVALSAAVVIVANDDDELTGPTARSAEATALPNQAVHSHPLETAPAPATRYDGGPEEGTRAIIAVPQAPDARYDGGPDEGTRAINAPTPGPAPERTTDGGSDQSTGQVVIPQGPGGPR
jgi:hypothetical protein